jgi:hypothetical protein
VTIAVTIGLAFAVAIGLFGHDPARIGTRAGSRPGLIPQRTSSAGPHRPLATSLLALVIQAAPLDALAHDALTGVPNRRGWDLGLARHLANARRSGEPVVTALLDLDHVKRFNDQHGHQAAEPATTATAG